MGPGAGDILAGPADPSRPRNPWPRLLAFGAFVLGSILLTGFCLVSFADAPNRDISVRLNEFQPGTPKFIAVTAFGNDVDGNTYGAFLAAPETGTALAFFSRDPDSTCNLRWEATATLEGVTGLFIDPCSSARYAFDGRAVHDGASRDLHRFAVRRDAVGYVVNFETMTLGTCRGATDGCSPAGSPQVRDVPSGTLPPEFGTR